jgi:hypothetical protein
MQQGQKRRCSMKNPRKLLSVMPLLDPNPRRIAQEMPESVVN